MERIIHLPKISIAVYAKHLFNEKSRFEYDCDGLEIYFSDLKKIMVLTFQFFLFFTGGRHLVLDVGLLHVGPGPIFGSWSSVTLVLERFLKLVLSNLGL